MSLPNVQFISRPLLDMTWGHPAPALLPAEALQQAVTKALADGGLTALPYGAEQGYGRLIELLCARIGHLEGVAPPPTRLAITGGISQAIDHLCTLLTKPGDIALVEAPTYHLALRILRDRGLRMVAVPADEQGMCLDTLAETIGELAARGERARLFYSVPTSSNPAGGLMGVERRVALAELAAAHDLILLEDDAYREIYFADPPPPAIATLCPDAPVVRLGSFAKCLAPGLRLGWITAPEELVIRWRKSGLLDSGGGVNHFTSCAVAELVASGELDRNTERLRAAYRQRRDTLLAALAAHLPTGSSVGPTAGGFFAWVRLPAGYDTTAMLPIAEEAGVAYIPGERFFANGSGHEYLRLSFSLLPLDQLTEGVRRLGEVLAAQS